MPKIRQYPPVTTTLPTDAVIMDRLGEGTVYAELGDLIAGANVLPFPTLPAAMAATIPAGTPYVQLLGQVTVGDSPAALYVPSSPGAALGKFQSADAQWWTLAPLSTGYPEWFGAVPGNPSFDCEPAIAASIAYFPVTRLAAKTYYVASTVALSTPYRKLIGLGAFPNPISVISIVSATLDTILVGLPAYPGSVGGYVQGLELSNVFATRTLPPAPPSSGFGGASGVRVQYVGGAYFSNVRAVNGTNGWWVKGAIYSTFERIYAARNVAGSPTTNDYFAGWIYDDSLEGTGPNEDNASVYIKQFGVSAGAQAGVGYGIFTINAFTDFFVTEMETAGCGIGVQLNGSTVGDPYPSENFFLSNSNFDQVSNGLIINSPNMNTAVTILNNQFTVETGSNTGQGITIINAPIAGAGGGITLVGNRILSNGGASTGIFVNNSFGVISRGNVILGCSFPITVSTGGNCSFSDFITNPSAVGAVDGAVNLTNCTRTVVDCSVYGAVGTFAIGVDMIGAGNSFNEVRCSGIDPACLPGGASATKLVSNGTNITSAGTFSTNNLAQGIMN